MRDQNQRQGSAIGSDAGASRVEISHESASRGSAAGGRQSRRTFLRRSGGLAAAVTLADVARQCHAAGSEAPVKLALVGCGGRGNGAVGNALSTSGGPVKLVAMADLFEPRLASSLGQLAKLFPTMVDVPEERQYVGFDAYKKAIDCLGPGDVVLLTTHAAFRPMHFEYAVKKGVNVFMEKSFATDSPSTRRLIRAAKAADEKNLKVSVGFMWRHSRARQDVIKRIHDGAIGDVHTLRIYRVHGPVHCPRRPADQNELVFQLQHPNSFSWVSSGFFIDWHCHNIDVACWAKGAWPVSAQGMGGRCYIEAGNQFDHYTVEYTFADGAKLFAFSRHMSGCWNTYADYVHGAKGSAVLMTSLAAPEPKIYKSQNMTAENVVWADPAPDGNPYVTEWQVLLDAIRRDTPHNEAHRAAEANFAGLMGRMATHTGQLVTWEQAVNSNFQYVADIDAMTFDTQAPIHEGPDGLYAAPTPGVSKEI